MNESKNDKVEAKQDPELPNNQDDKAKNDGIIKYISHANHPLVCFLTIIFKLSSVICFVFLSIFFDSNALIYLIVILLASCDFWMTKNVSGRLLVGLRWWNEVREDGNEVWIFESKNEKTEPSADSRVFWTSVYLSAAFWFLIVIWDLISLKWIWAIIALVCLAFSGMNLYGYLKCSKTQQANISKYGAKAMMKVMSKGKDLAVNEVMKEGAK